MDSGPGCLRRRALTPPSCSRRTVTVTDPSVQKSAPESEKNTRPHWDRQSVRYRSAVMASSIVAAPPPPPPSTSWDEAASGAAGLTAGAHQQRSHQLPTTQHAHFSPDFVVQNHQQPVYDDACPPSSGTQHGRNAKGNQCYYCTVQVLQPNRCSQTVTESLLTSRFR